MRPRRLFAATGLLLTMAAFLYLGSGKKPEPDTPAKARQPSPISPSRETAGISSRPTNPQSTPTLPLPLEEEIENAVVTYSPAGLPTFEKLLASGEPDIREAARDGLVRLGETGGAALLRRASARLTDPDEIKKFLETADYLELPSASEGPFKK
ncbi:MAG: hypothetical protein CFE26_11080 [Verrucomicrobiales bacterium VVV1]|nr:MAG: hypothetical protein CFE26_11080 [Verrucomicrobiales bacterium VVV1]